VRAVVIFNPTSGRSRGGAAADAVVKSLTRHGFDVEPQATQGCGDASHIAERWVAETDVIVAVDGDGTINEIANGMVRGAIPGSGGPTARPLLGIVPAGTVNVLALELGIPFQIERACRVIADSVAENRKVAFDLGKVDERRFLLMMGAGIDALTIRNISPKAKKRFRELAFVSAGARTGFAGGPLPEFVVHANGEEYVATFFVASNTHYYGGRFGVTPKADPTDGLLDLLLFRGTRSSSLAVFWLEVPSNLHLQNQKVLILRADSAELTFKDPDQVVWFQTDGELAGRLPAAIGIEPQALDILIPRPRRGLRSAIERTDT
jgi:diacylglycerol kinase (ATP)